MAVPLSQPLCAVCALKDPRTQNVAVTQVHGTTVCGLCAYPMMLAEYGLDTVKTLANGAGKFPDSKIPPRRGW